ncbi:MAG: diguanylate cyclase [Burkholderiales bacterium]|nr:diguanylate cyclase [Burkholderiales bacterium]
MIDASVNETPDPEALATARRTLALLQAQAEAVRADLASLRRETEKAKQELSGLRTAQLLEVNDRLVQAAVHADTAAQTAVSSLDELNRSTQHDELTGATTRVLMLDRLQSAIARAQRTAARVGLLFLDLDGFKAINDTLGHGVGDQVLRLAAQRLASVVRESDSVSRYGGDEFVVLLAEMSSAADAAPIARKMLDALAAPALIGAHPVSLLASIGIAIYPEDGADAVTLIRHADAAMYRSKRRGAGGFEFYQDDGTTDPASGLDSEPMQLATRRADVAFSEHEARLRELLEANRDLVGAAQVAQKLQANAEAAHHRQINFVAMAAHALRNPLSAIRMATTLLSDSRIEGPMKERQLQLVQRQAALIARLIDDLLDGSRVGAGEFRLQRRELQLDSILGVAADACRHAIDAKQQRLVVRAPVEPALVNGDPQRLIQVFSNLLNNASRRSPAGGAVTLTTQVEARRIVVTVADEGTGIAPDVLAGIFDLFAVDTQVPLEEAGLGIGLAVVRALAEAHGGSVGVNCGPGDRGSEFVVRLPRIGDAPAA